MKWKANNKKRKTPKYFFIISLGIFLFLGVGYSVIHTNFNISGNVIASANRWNIIFDNIAYSDENYTTEEKVSITNGTQLNLNLELTNPGDKYEFTFDIKNQGTLDALIKTLSIDDITEEQKVYLEYIVEYTDESKLEVNDLIKQSESKTVRVLVRYKDLRATDLLPKEDVDLNLNILINFYYPQEENYELNLIQGTATNHYQVKNTQQEVSLSDITLSDTDTVIACNNGAIPTTDDTGLITVKHIKQDTTCRIESSLKNAIDNTLTSSTVTLLKDITTTERIDIETGKSIILNLNQKKVVHNCSDPNVPLFLVSGSLKINGQNSEMKTLGHLLIQGSGSPNLFFNSGSYLRLIENGTGGVLRACGNTIIRNANFESTWSWALGAYCDNSVVNIYNSTFRSAIGITSNNSIVNIYNSEVNSIGHPPLVIDADKNGYINICKSRLTSSNKDLIRDVHLFSYLFFDKNTIFTNETNTPILSSGTNKKFAVRTDYACKE